MIYYARYSSLLGKLLLTCEDDALTGIWMDKNPSETMTPGSDHPILQKVAAWLDGYFSGRVEPAPVRLDPPGTVFQQRIWKRLLEIPYGIVCTYGDIAREMELETGCRMSAQAVGGAVGRNPISIMIPCHRVVGAKGKLTGYASGLDKKIWLLSHEGWEGVREYDHK